MRRAMRAWGRRVGGAAVALGVGGVAGAANIWVVDGDGTINQSFLTIQDAIDFASPGDTIVVRGEGTVSAYDEAVLINKDNLTVVGEGNTIIDGCDNDFQVTIVASGVRFQGFHLNNDGCDGIRVNGSDNWVVANWVENPDGPGVQLKGDSKRNTVLGNWITNPNSNGIYETDGSGGWGHLIAYNVVSGGNSDGIHFHVPKVTVDTNVVVSNDGDGIDIDSDNADQFKLTNNIALDNNSGPGGNADLDRESGAVGTFKKNVFGTCQLNDGSLSTCPAF